MIGEWFALVLSWVDIRLVLFLISWIVLGMLLGSGFGGAAKLGGPEERR